MSSPYASDAAPTHFIEFDGHRIAYRTLGEGPGLPLVLSMRFRGVMDEWDPAFLDAVAAHRRIFWFDSAGVGLSSGEVPDSIPRMANILTGFVDALELQKVDLLGWSMGGYVVQSATVQRPDLVRRLVVAGSGPGGVPDAPKAPDRVWQVAGKPVNEDADFLYLFFPESEDGISAGRKHLARLGQRNEAVEPRVGEAAVKAMVAAFAKFRAEDAIYPHLGRLSLPILYANGTDDVMIHAFNSYAAALAAPNAQLILYPRSGHGFLFHHIDSFARDLANFLDAGDGIRE